MITAVTSFLLIFAAMNVAYLFLQRQANRRVTRRQSTRLASRSEQEAAPGTEGGAVLIRRAKPGGGKRAGVLSLGFAAEERLSRLLESAGVHQSKASFMRKCAAMAAAGGTLWLVFASSSISLLALPVGALCGMLPVLGLRRKARMRVHAFEAQFPDGLEFVSRSMRAGHAFSVSLELLYKEFDDPMAGEFRRIFEEQNLGMPLETALGRFSVRIPSMDVHFFTSAVLLQRKTGGNLTEILDKLAQLIRERYKLRGKIRAVSAHGRMTGKALCAIPMFVGVMMFFVNRDYADFFLHTVQGKEMIAGALGLQLIGYLVIQKIVNIEI